MKLERPRALLSVALSTVFLGCGSEPAPIATDPSAPPSAGTVASTADSSGLAVEANAPIARPTTGEATNHYLTGETLFAANAGYESGTLYADPAQQTAPPSADGTATFWNFVSQRPMQTAHYWRTRPAKAEELAVGKLALMPNRRGEQGIYGPPGSAAEAYETRWWITRIVSVRPLAEGYVLVAGNYKVAPGAIRSLEGDDSPEVRAQGKEDEHFLADEHWFVGNAPLPTKNHLYLDPAVALRPEAPLEGGEGRFVQTNNGKITLTANAWQSRRASKGELEVGLLVIAPNIREGAIYRAPKTRAEALSTRWWAVKIAKVDKLGKGTVGVEGDYEVAVDALRLVK